MSLAKRDLEFSAFVDARRRHLLRLAFLICGNWHQAEDVLQTSLIKLYTAWPRLHRDGREEAYVRQIIVRTHIDERRRPQRNEMLGLDDHLDHPAPRSTSYEDRSTLWAALEELPAMQRKTIVLRHWLGFSVEETAAELGISPGTVKSYSARAIAKLQTALSHQ